MTESTITPPVPSSESEDNAALIPIDQDETSLADTGVKRKLAEIPLGLMPQKQKRIVGIVVSAGKMEKTVKVRIPGQTWNNYLRKASPPRTRPPSHRATTNTRPALQL